MNYQIVVEKTFSSAHALRGYKGKCERLHGHNWKIKAYVSGDKLNNIGLLFDFKELKKILDDILYKIDHKNLIGIKPFDKINPTAENIATYIYENLKRKINKYKHLEIDKIEVWESDTSSVAVSEKKL